MFSVEGTGVSPNNIRYVKVKDSNNNLIARLVRYLGAESRVEIAGSVEGVDVTQIAPKAFWNSSSITRLEIPSTVELIDHEAFFGCDNLLWVIVNGQTPSVLAVDAFEKTTNLVAIYTKHNLENYKVATGWIEYEDILYSLNIVERGFAVDNGRLIQYIGDAKNIILPNTVDTISITAFYGRKDIESIEISSSVSTVEGFPNLSLHPDFVIKVNAENNYFAVVDNVLYNKDMTKLVWYPPNNAAEQFELLVSVKHIMEYAFMHTKLTSIHLNSVESIGDYAFYAISINDIYFEGNPPILGEEALDIYATVNVYVPQSKVSEYQELFAKHSKYTVIGY